MHIEQKHTLGTEAAKRRIDTLMEEALRQAPPPGVKVNDFSKTWSGDTMRISFTAKKGFFGVSIVAVVQVADDLVTADAELPGLLTAFVSEDKIKAGLQQQLAQGLAA